MSLFYIHSMGNRIGQSRLEFGDPPMGVAHGEFIPLSGYDTIRPLVVGTYGSQNHLGFKVFAEDGREIECAWIALNDQSDEFAREGLQVELSTLSERVYTEFFPHHIAEYAGRFPQEP